MAVAALAMGCGLACAQVGGQPAGLDKSGRREVSRGQFRADVARLMALTVACGASSKNCDAKAVGDDEAVAAEGQAQAFVVHWDWLRDALDKAKEAQPAPPGEPAYDRGEAMSEAYAHLQAIAGDAAPGSAEANADAGFARARAEASAVLARAEFRRDVPPSWWQRAWAKFVMAVDGLFNGVGKLGKAAPWLGELLEVLLYLGVAVGLVVFVRRSFARQRLAVSLGAGVARLDAWDREATDWARLAESCAARQQWREAVHCLYWAAIVGLESRRAWRHNPARTPREYVRLLRPGSAQQGALRGLTQIFERVWYGLRDAGSEDYARARGLFEGLLEGPSNEWSGRSPGAAGETGPNRPAAETT